MDNCERCGKKAELFWNDDFGGALCEKCDMALADGAPIEIQPKTERDDIHKPSLLDPAEYEFMAAFYQGSSEDMMRSYQYDMQEYDEALEQYPVFQGNHDTKGTCDHCGAAFAHGALFLHIPTQELIHVGHICADNTVGLPDKAAAARKKAEKYAAAQKAHRKQMEKTQAWRDEHEELVTWLNWTVENENAHDFLSSLLGTINKWGDLSEAQTRAAYKWMEGAKKKAERAAEDAVRLANAPAVSEGRYDIIAEIVSTKWQSSDFGDQLKMLVLLSDGNKLWGTMPKVLRSRQAEAGTKVKFTATVTKSNKDEHFGFFAKPTNAEVI